MKISKSRLKEIIKTIIREEKTAYQEFFTKALSKFGVSSPKELKGDKEKEFYDYLNQQETTNN